jgi:ubiquinone/menaquinone biosynthesis C-methylase UbiE
MFERIRDIWARFSGAGIYPHELSGLLLMPLRRFVLSPAQLVAHLQLSPSAYVLEIGPGPGYFSPTLARAVPGGRLVLADVQREMLVKARERLERHGSRMPWLAQADAGRLPFADAVFDLVLLVAVLGELPDRRAGLVSIAHVLRPGGRLAVVELPGDADELTAGELADLAEGLPIARMATARVGRATVTTFERT